jgi:hypothetical protein
MTTRSSWDETQAKSSYHFNKDIVDTKDEVITTLGRINPTWGDDLDEIISTSRPAQWANRGYKGEGVEVPPEDLAAEEYDIARVGADPNQIISHINWKLPESLQAITNAFGLDDCMARIHVQYPGELWHRHIDKLQKWSPEDPSKVLRAFVQLTSWQPGQFWEYGNYHWNQWAAGDVSTFDWANIPHSTANAGHHPRVTLQLTGVITEKTKAYLKELAA